PQTFPLRSQPAAPIVARIGEQLLTAPEPTDPVGHGPLCSSLLAHGIHAHALDEVHLHRIGQADHADQASDHRLGRQANDSRSDSPIDIIGDSVYLLYAQLAYLTRQTTTIPDRART